MFCPKCGKENNNESRFCSNCGAPLPVTGEGSSPQNSQNEQDEAPAEEIEISGKKFKEKAGQKQTGTDGTSGSSESGPVPMNEKRSFPAYLLVGMITCGIYMLYVVYTFARDVNIICKEDGETTPGLIRLILLSIVTCSVYSFVWYYRMLRRIERQEKNWNIQPVTVGGIELDAAACPSDLAVSQKASPKSTCRIILDRLRIIPGCLYDPDA